MMDFFSALLESQFSGTPAFRPRIPALFEPIAPRVDLARFDESSHDAADETARVEIQNDARTVTRVASQSERTPYRGVMNVPPIIHTADAPESKPAQNIASRASQPFVAAVQESPTERVEQNARAQSETRMMIEKETRAEPPTARDAIVPAPLLEPRALEPRAESDAQRDLAAQPASIIRVNIGSIIVRAMPSRTERSPAMNTSPRSLPPAKKISLDDYLKKHERGER